MVTSQANAYLGKGKSCESTPKNQGTSWVLPALAENQMPLRQSELKAQRHPSEARGKPSKTLMLPRKQGLEQGLSPAPAALSPSPTEGALSIPCGWQTR